MAVTINASLTTGIGIAGDNSGAIQFQSNGTNTLLLDSSGNPYINTVVATTASAANMFVDTTTTPYGQIKRSTSSERYKTNIRDYDKGLEAVSDLRPVYYKGINDGDREYAGLIAEEVDAAGLKEFVQYNAAHKPDALAYGNMVALLIKALQEANTKIEALEQRVAVLEVK